MHDDLPAAAGPAHLRPDAAHARRQRALPAVRRLRQELLRLQPARRLPGRPERRTTPTGAATASTSSARSRASCSASSPSRSSRWCSGIGHGGEPRRLRHAHHVLEDDRRTRSPPSSAPSRSALFYWYAADVGPDRADLGAPRRRRSRSPRPGSCARSRRRSRSWRRPRPPAAGARRRPRRPRSLARASRRCTAGRPQVTFVPDNKRVVAKPGQSLLEIAEANGLPIEAGCRMGICGADPVAIKDGHGVHVGDRRRRAGHARTPRPRRRTRGWRAARGSPARSRVVAHARTSRARRASARSRGFSYDTPVERVVILGNGIAGVTAADHVRRRHPACRDRPDRRGAAPPLQPHGHRAPVYGRSAMQGLYLNPDAWYDERGITTWLNTRAL